jgi:hypothetical protein
MVTTAPGGPDVGDKLLMFSVVRVKAIPLLGTPFTVTTTLPLEAPLGISAWMAVVLQLVGDNAAPFKVTVLAPWELPKLEPLMVRAVPTGPDEGDRLVMFGGTVNVIPLLLWPATVTITGPVVAEAGTFTVILVLLQLVAVATPPLNVTWLPVWLAPKLDPLIVTAVPKTPDVGEMLLITGAAPGTVNVVPLLAKPLTVTTTLPVVAPLGTGTTMLATPHEVGVAAVPLKVTVLLPWVVPNPAPLIVTDAPTAAVFGEIPVMIGITRKDCALLARPLTVTVTLAKPAARLLGTGTPVSEVADQVVGFTVMPPKFTVLVPWELPKFVPVMVIEDPTGDGGPTLGDKLVMLGAVWA